MRGCACDEAWHLHKMLGRCYFPAAHRRGCVLLARCPPLLRCAREYVRKRFMTLKLAHPFDSIRIPPAHPQRNPACPSGSTNPLCAGACVSGQGGPTCASCPKGRVHRLKVGSVDAAPSSAPPGFVSLDRTLCAMQCCLMQCARAIRIPTYMPPQPRHCNHQNTGSWSVGGRAEDVKRECTPCPAGFTTLGKGFDSSAGCGGEWRLGVMHAQHCLQSSGLRRMTKRRRRRPALLPPWLSPPALSDFALMRHLAFTPPIHTSVRRWVWRLHMRGLPKGLLLDRRHQQELETGLHRLRLVQDDRRHRLDVERRLRIMCALQSRACRV